MAFKATSEVISRRRAFGAVGRCCTLAMVLSLLGACANSERMPSTPWILGATILSAAGMPPKRPDFYDAPVRVSETLKFTAITAGADHTCAIEVGGDTYCWGSNQYEQLGIAGPTETCGAGRLPCSSTPVRLAEAPRFIALAASMWGTCGIDAAGRASCWGFGLGARRNGSLPPTSGVPVEVPGRRELVALTSSVSGNGACGLTAIGDAWCWSVPGGGQSPFAGPNRIAAPSKFVSIGGSDVHGCGIDEALDAFCWGSNQFGQLGVGSSGFDGGLRESAGAVAVNGRLTLERVVSGGQYSCALNTEGAVYCWGQSFDADGSAPRVPDRRSIRHGSLPVRIETASSRWVALSAGMTQVCGLSDSGDIYCFTTIPTRRGARRSERIESEQTFVSVAVGGQHVCAIGADAFAYCSGLSHAAQVGRAPTGRPVRRKRAARDSSS